MMTTLQQTIFEEIQVLPENLLEELLDFIRFLRSPKDEDAFAVEQIQATSDYRNKNEDSVITVTAEEFLQDTEELTPELV